MTSRIEALEAEVLKLTPAGRSQLLARLIASLDVDPDVESAWNELADRREAELVAGSAALVPGHEALERLNARLER